VLSHHNLVHGHKLMALLEAARGAVTLGCAQPGSRTGSVSRRRASTAMRAPGAWRRSRSRRVVKRAPKAGEHHKSETIIGQPQQAGEATVIPVHRLKIAFGAASAKAGAHAGKSGADSGGQGAGGAVELDPVAAIAVGKDGHAHLLTVDSDAVSSWSQLIAEVPDLVARLAHTSATA
jgi:uncharacterized spore protein YtfJ